MAADLTEIYELLLKEYGEQGWWPVNGTYSPSFKKRKRTEKERFEICIGAILAQNTSWKNVVQALGNLRNANALSREGVGKLTPKDLGTLIRPARYFNVKSRKIREFLKYSGRITREGLLSIWGLGPETVDSMLLYAYGKGVIPVDAYTERILYRVGICEKEISYEELQEVFYEELPRDAELFNECHALLVEHAQKHCKVKPVCKGCPLGEVCGKWGVKI